MSATVTALELLGLISGAAHPTDGRQTVFSLTAVCRQLFKTTRTAREDWLFHTIETALSPKEQRQLAAAMQLLRRIAEWRA